MRRLTNLNLTEEDVHIAAYLRAFDDLHLAAEQSRNNADNSISEVEPRPTKAFRQVDRQDLVEVAELTDAQS